MAFTKSDLATRILRDLGLVASEETPSAADVEFTEQTIDSEFALLEADGINIWGASDDSIPSQYLTALSRRIGMRVRGAFGQPQPSEDEMQDANKVLRRLAQVGPTYEVLPVDGTYF